MSKNFPTLNRRLNDPDNTTRLSRADTGQPSNQTVKPSTPSGPTSGHVKHNGQSDEEPRCHNKPLLNNLSNTNLNFKVSALLVRSLHIIEIRPEVLNRAKDVFPKFLLIHILYEKTLFFAFMSL
ncbi:hypothetical protein ACTXT7_016145 [Hymenolepis weldensis]